LYTEYSDKIGLSRKILRKILRKIYRNIGYMSVICYSGILREIGRKTIKTNTGYHFQRLDDARWAFLGIIRAPLSITS
jgi:hypothetical protein